MISFVIYFHSSRLQNLQQTLRFLSKHEKVSEYELILVCHDSIETFSTNFGNTKLFNLNLESYCKPKMCNFGVNQATKDIIILLDSDRILPKNYFSVNAKRLKEKEIIVPYRLYSLDREYSDEEILSGKVGLIQDFRSKGNTFFQKNAFSGNTMIHKKDYIPMDETFIGYGFADNDATLTALKNGLSITYTNDIELHLYHQRETYMFGKKLDYDKTMSVCEKNAIHFARKWNLDYHRKVII